MAAERRAGARGPERSLGGVVLEVPPRLSPPSTDVPVATTADAASADPVATPAVLDAQLRDRLNRIPAAFHPDPVTRDTDACPVDRRRSGARRRSQVELLIRSSAHPIGYADFTAAAAGWRDVSEGVG